MGSKAGIAYKFYLFIFSLIFIFFIALSLVLVKGGIERVKHLNGLGCTDFKSVFKHAKKCTRKS